ncbi:hypothetical protein [Kurthia populi]
MYQNNDFGVMKMIYRQIKGDAINEYEGTPEEIKAMLKAECNHTGLYDHVAWNTGNGVEIVCLRCREAHSNKDDNEESEITYRTTEEGYLQSEHSDNVFTLAPICMSCKKSGASNKGPFCEKCAKNFS